jgi:hypothetical protein
MSKRRKQKETRGCDTAGRTAISRATSSSSSETAQTENDTALSQEHKPSWRDFYEPHPAALVFHQHTTDEDRQKMSDDLKENQRLQTRIVTAHVADESGGKTYVVDGITRLDEMEKLGWHIVDEHGNWMGAVQDQVDHRRNYTHEQVGKLVISLNAKRRHTEKSILADAIVEALKLERKEGYRVSHNQNEKLPQERKASKRGRLGEGRPRDEFKAEAVKRGTEAGISKPTMEKALGRQPDRQKIESRTRKPKSHSKLLNGDDASKVFDEEKFTDKLYKQWINLIRHVDADKRPSAMRLVKEWVEFVERAPFAVEDSGWNLIKRLRPLHSNYARNRRELVSRLITKWIAGKGGAA